MESVWEFHDDPVALTKITPVVHVRVEHCDYPVRKGSIIRLTLSVATFHIRWNSLIAECNPNHLFIDEQLKNQGPFKRWKHTHRFMAVGRGTQITDSVEYEMPFGLLGKIVERVFGRFIIKSMFDARSRATRTFLEGRSAGRVLVNG